ncbi:MAG: phosphotransferase [Candidatus Limnocylindrales bacterium]
MVRDTGFGHGVRSRAPARAALGDISGHRAAGIGRGGGARAARGRSGRLARGGRHHLLHAEGRLRHILHGLPWARDPLPAWLRARLRHAADAIGSGWDTRRDAESFRTDETLALLHGDIALGNVLWGPNPVLIDWEYARLGDPSDEIAYLFDQNGLAAPQRDAFWRGYRARISSEARLAPVIERVNWWEPLTLLGSTLWWVERWVRRADADAAGSIDPAVPREAGYYLDQVVRRLDRLEPLLAPA